MIKRIVFLVYCCCLFLNGICQESFPKYSNFPDASDDSVYFALLFGRNGSINNPHAILKIEMKEKPYFYITSKEGLQQYFKSKYSINDSAASARELLFLKAKCKLSFSDSTIDFNKIRQYPDQQATLCPDTLLDKYRKLDLVDFLNSYCLPDSHANLFVIAYMFEKRMLFDWNIEHIEFYTKSLLATKYGIHLDKEKKRWLRISR